MAAQLIPPIDTRTPTEKARDFLSSYPDEVMAVDLRSALQADIANMIANMQSALEAGGMVLVPMEPTQEMVLAALASAVEEDGGVGYYPYRFYKSMLAARPQGGK